MVDSPKENNNDNGKDPVEDKPPEIQPKHQRQRCCSKPRRAKDNNTGTQENNSLTMPKIVKTPLSQPSNRTNGKMGESALRNKS